MYMAISHLLWSISFQHGGPTVTALRARSTWRDGPARFRPSWSGSAHKPGPGLTKVCL